MIEFNKEVNIHQWSGVFGAGLVDDGETTINPFFQGSLTVLNPKSSTILWVPKISAPAILLKQGR